ncbi:MAG: hypothetical protein HYS27_17070 [Deltaproteobacteria bacterium]|nr:hypothetical protein [Deltaproteobacteria bacterium]
MRTPLLAGLSIATLAATGCLQQYQYLDPHANEQQWNTGGPGAVGTALEFNGSGSLSGDIGPVKGFQGTNGVQIEGYDDGVCTYVTITGIGDNGTGSMVVDVMPRVDDLGEGSHGVGYYDDGYGEGAEEISTVTTQANAGDGDTFYGDAQDGAVIMTLLPDGTRQLEVHALVDDGSGQLTEAIGEFRLRPTR